MNGGIPNVRYRSRRIQATPCASFNGIGYAIKSLGALSIPPLAGTRCPLPMCWGISVNPPPTPSKVEGVKLFAWRYAGYVAVSYVCTRTILRALARLLLLLLFSHTNRLIKSVVTGQDPVTLELRNTPITPTSQRRYTHI